MFAVSRLASARSFNSTARSSRSVAMAPRTPRLGAVRSAITCARTAPMRASVTVALMSSASNGPLTWRSTLGSARGRRAQECRWRTRRCAGETPRSSSSQRGTGTALIDAVEINGALRRADPELLQLEPVAADQTSHGRSHVERGRLVRNVERAISRSTARCRRRSAGWRRAPGIVPAVARRRPAHCPRSPPSRPRSSAPRWRTCASTSGPATGA